MTIKHLVISGGGPVMIQILAAIQHLEQKQFINIKDIETIYGTSAGAILGVLICLKFDWETINDYIIKRPWKEVFVIKVQNILDSYTKKGIFDVKTIEKCFKPLFDAKDIPLDINLRDFYELSGIELHMFSFEINDYKTHDISYLTHPELPLMTALQMTCGIPMLLIPICMDDKCYIDGGMYCNYPLDKCIESGKIEDEILGFKNKYNNNDDENKNVDNDSTLLDLMMNILFKIITNVNIHKCNPIIKNELVCDAERLSFSNLQNTFSNIETRRELFNRGTESAKQFLSTLDSG